MSSIMIVADTFAEAAPATANTPANAKPANTLLFIVMISPFLVCNLSFSLTTCAAVCAVCAVCVPEAAVEAENLPVLCDV